ncbi:trehalose-phosphatase [Rhodobacterales bacterium HKCCE2091]|nr:trehalose-phosphatase [Rhodobacterales bacterium HKCCE2091]
MTHIAATELSPPPPRTIDPSGHAIFLDFDGCLVELAERPDAIRVPDDLPAILDRLDRRFEGRVSLISGRPAADIVRYLGDFRGPIYGNHGAELHHGGKSMVRTRVAGELDEIAERAERLCAATDGLLLERKSTGIAIHYRRAPEAEPIVRGFLDGVAARHPDLEMQPAKMAMELRPRGVDKASALNDAVERFGWDHKLPVHIGDDATDEWAFHAADARGGFGIKVGEGDTIAHYRLSGPAAVLDLLRDWAGA